MKRLHSRVLCLAFIALFISGSASTQSQSQAASSWRPIKFDVDIPNVIGRSDIVLARPNPEPGQAMPLGNGRFGVAVWSADGLTAQLNRNDTMPDRLSSGQVVLPGLAILTEARDYSGRLDLFRGEFREKGGGLGATAYVEPATDALVIDVSGANPSVPQTAVLRLWSPRSPHASASGPVGILTQSWIDDKNPGASHRPFGSLAAITAEGRDVSAFVSDPYTVTVTFRPRLDGHFRITAASPHYDGAGDPAAIASAALAPQPSSAHLDSWRDFWTRAATIKITSTDGAGEYMENLRNLYLFVADIDKGVEFPGSQAGLADMISSAKDEHKWDPSAFWHWNLRMQVAANIGAGLPDLNETYFNLYSENLANIESWTKDHMKGLPGVCVPETMRFNGPGIEYESGWKPVAEGHNCDADFKPYYNARTTSTGAEVSLWVWQQYLATNDLKFLAANYPLMAASARFLLAYQKPGPDRKLHTSPSNAHETQWDVTDPTTDVSAIRALFPATIQAANVLGKDSDLAAQLQTALAKTPLLPRILITDPHTVLPANVPSKEDDVIAESYEPAAEHHNIENIGLEPVWPYGIIGDTSPLFSLAQRTYAHRPNISAVDWSFDPIQAARLGLGSEVASTLIETTRKFQGYINGMAKWEASAKEFYVEQTGVVADALQEALVQDYDGTIRIAPAIPPGWDFDGSVFVRGKTKVDVQTRNSVVTTAIIESGSTGQLSLRNPWPGKQVDVLLAANGKAVTTRTAGPNIVFDATEATSYIVLPHETAATTPHLAPITGTPATTAKKLGPVQIGLFANTP